MDLFTYLLKKKGHNSSVNGDLFSYLLASRKRGTYQTYTGTQINVNDSINARMKNWILGGNTNQNGTPTPDAPIDIHNVVGENNVIENSGKNLYEPLFENRNLNGLTPVLNNDGSVSVSGTITQTWSNICKRQDIYLEAGTYTFSVSQTYTHRVVLRVFKSKQQEDQQETNYENVEIGPGSTKKTFTTTSKIYGWRVYITGLTANTEVDENFKLQVEVGSTATTFEKYKGKNYKVSLSSKNLMFYNTAQFTTNEKTWYFLNGQKGAYGINIGTKTNIKTPVESGKTYTISCNVNIQIDAIQPVYSDELVITTDTGEIGKHTITFTAIKTDNIIIRVRPKNNQNVDISNIQIEVGNEATPYVPYMTPIELCKIGDYQDKIYKSNDKWLLEKNVGKFVCNGTQNITYITIQGTTLLAQINLGLGNLRPNNMLSNLLPYREDNWNKQEETIGIGGVSYNQLQIVLNTDRLESSDVTGFNKFISENNLIVYLQLKTPNITEITDDNLINQLEELSKARSFDEHTNITQLSEQLPFDLTVDIKSL